MQDIRNLLGIKSVQWKVEKRSLQRIDHVLRLSDERPAKRAVQEWNPLLETVDRQRKIWRNTPQSWRRLITEAEIDPSDLDRLTEKSTEWRKIVRKRMSFPEQWEKSKGKREQTIETIKNETKQLKSLTCRYCQ